MNLKPVSEWSKSKREKYCIFFTNIHMESKKKYWWTYLQRRNGDPDEENGLVDTGGGGEDRTNWKSSIAYMSSHV